MSETRWKLRLSIVAIPLAAALLFFPRSSVQATSPQPIEETIYLSLTAGEVGSAIRAYRIVLNARVKHLAGALLSLIRLLESMAEAIDWLRKEGHEAASIELLKEYIRGAQALNHRAQTLAGYYQAAGGLSFPDPPPPGPEWLDWYRAKSHRDTMRAHLEKCGSTMRRAAELIGETAGFETERDNFLKAAARGYLLAQDAAQTGGKIQELGSVAQGKGRSHEER